MFNLEAAVRQWHRKIRKNPALEDGYIAELESHLREDISQYIRLGHAEEEAFDKAVGNIGPIDTIATEYYKTDTRHIIGQPPWEKDRWGLMLLGGYLDDCVEKSTQIQGLFSHQYCRPRYRHGVLSYHSCLCKQRARV